MKTVKMLLQMLLVWFAAYLAVLALGPFWGALAIVVYVYHAVLDWEPDMAEGLLRTAWGAGGEIVAYMLMTAGVNAALVLYAAAVYGPRAVAPTAGLTLGLEIGAGMVYLLTRPFYKPEAHHPALYQSLKRIEWAALFLLLAAVYILYGQQVMGMLLALLVAINALAYAVTAIIARWPEIRSGIKTAAHWPAKR